ncbi:helix-turn-helix domain-containing protein [Catenuloplanes japonicus]|uniref:helix-turn-helix domain-containing protein n=1 Tax=Catenuloplanes japonicus TaxID=33876 RepID=UPI0005241DAC|nr:helix-turn-helix transcriptional regulator [Catenuloplanes japonicus]
MAGDSGSPTVRRRQLGGLLRRRREALGLSAQEVAERLLVSPAKISRLETGQRAPQQRDIRDLCDLYGISDPAERDALMSLVAEARKLGWWQEMDLPTSAYVDLEGAATQLGNWETALVPGLLQTPAYAEWALLSWDRRLTPDQVEQAARARRRRQERLTGDDPLTVRAILDESVLRRMNGSGIARGQLEHLLALSELPTVSIQILPYEVGLHEAVNSPFALLDLDVTAGGVVFVEGLVGYLYLEKPEQLARYREVFQWLRNAALSPADTTVFISDYVQKLR